MIELEKYYSRAWNFSGYPHVIGSGLLGLHGLVADAGTVQEVVFGWLLIILATMHLFRPINPNL